MAHSRPSRNRFYLVQRLSPQEWPNAKGFDAYFSCEYMGSAEFEWGALPDSLKRLRAGKLIATTLDVDGVTVWFVHDVTNTTVHEDFLNWVTGGPRDRKSVV